MAHAAVLLLVVVLIFAALAVARLLTDWFADR